MTRFMPLLIAGLLAMSAGCQNKPSSDNDSAPSNPQAKTSDAPDKKVQPKQPDKKPTKPAADPAAEKLAAEIRKIVGRYLNVEPETLGAKTSLKSKESDDIEYQLKLNDILIDINKKFKIEVSDEDLGDLETLTLDKLTAVVRKFQRRMFGG